MKTLFNSLIAEQNTLRFYLWDPECMHTDRFERIRRAIKYLANRSHC